MNICFYCADQNPHRDRSLGITNYTFSLLSHLLKSGEVSLQALASKSSVGLPAGISMTALPFRTDHTFGRLLADHLHPFLAYGVRGADLWHYPKGFLPLGPQVRKPKVGTIADTILQFYADNYPGFRSKAAYAYWIAMLKNAIVHFDLILTVSEFSKRSILEFAQRHRLKEPAVFVTYQGADVDYVERKQKGDYVLHLASHHPHKKTNWLLAEWSKLQSSAAPLPTLRLVGQLDSVGNDLVGKLKNTEVVANIDRQTFLQMMSGALALILPSEIEGFGLPALEAYYCDTPVVYRKGTAVEEVLGSGWLGGFELNDDSLSVALTEALNMARTEIEKKRTELESRFSWRGCVDRTLEAYRTLGPN
jgi:glycosyltransferase involved in cell wall biosynthesis